MNKPETNRFELKAELMQQMLRGEITMGEVGRRIRTEGYA